MSTIELAKRGDRAALDALLRDRLPAVRGVLFRLAGGPPDLDDLTQRTLVEVVRALPSFRGESAFATWVHRIAVRVAWDHLRARRNVVPLDVAPEPFSDGALDARIALRELKACLARLTPERRIVFVLHDIEQNTAREIAEMLDVPEGTVNGRLREARAQVASAMEEPRRIAR